MKNIILITVLFIVSMSLIGCVAIVGDCDKCQKKLCAKTINCATTNAEIKAIGKLSSEQAKIEAYKVIATRENVTGLERIALMDAIYKSSIPQTDKEDIILTLIRNRGVQHPLQDNPDKNYNSKTEK